MLNQNVYLGICLKTGDWNAASLAVVQPGFGEPLHWEVKAPSSTGILITTLGTDFG